MPNPSQASPPGAPLSTVGVTALAAALGTNRSQLLRRIVGGQVPEGIRTRGGGVGPGHRRWKLADAMTIVRKAGRPVPEAWGARPAAAGGGR